MLPETRLAVRAHGLITILAIGDHLPREGELHQHIRRRRMPVIVPVHAVRRRPHLGRCHVAQEEQQQVDHVRPHRQDIAFGHAADALDPADATIEQDLTQLPAGAEIAALHVHGDLDPRLLDAGLDALDLRRRQGDRLLHENPLHAILRRQFDRLLAYRRRGDDVHDVRALCRQHRLILLVKVLDMELAAGAIQPFAVHVTGGNELDLLDALVGRHMNCRARAAPENRCFVRHGYGLSCLPCEHPRATMHEDERLSPPAPRTTSEPAAS